MQRACSTELRSYEITAHGACDSTLSLCMCARERRWRRETERDKGLRDTRRQCHNDESGDSSASPQRGLRERSQRNRDSVRSEEKHGRERVQSCGHSGECTGESVESKYGVLTTFRSL